MSKFGYLAYSFDRKTRFFRPKKSNLFRTLDWPGLALELDLANLLGAKKVRKLIQNVENIEKIDDFMVPEVPSKIAKVGVPSMGSGPVQPGW